MRVVTQAEIDGALDTPSLIEALASAFAGAVAAPPRHHHVVPRPGEPDATFLLMPAWSTGERVAMLGLKTVSVFPGNAGRGLPSVQGTYLLMDGETGRPLAAMDGARLTLWRTAAASALAARHLARPDSSRMVMVGTGALSPFLARAHGAVRPIDRIAIWGRNPDSAARVADALAVEGLPAVPAGDLEAEVREADLVSCATLSAEPLVRGAWLRPGTHLDLVGAYAMAMRESDDEALARARVFVDTPACLHEGGDVAVAIAAGTFRADAVQGDLADLVTGRVRGRESRSEITLFKSIGASIEDLAAAELVWRRLGEPA